MVAPPPPSPPALPLLLLAVLAALLATGEAIQCYTCSSMKDAYCADPFDSGQAYKLQCTPDAVQKSVHDATKALSDMFTKFGVDVPTGTMELAFVCQKMKQTDKRGNEVVLRSCAFNPETVNTCPPENAGAQCLQCNSDLCNAAPPGPGATGARLLALLALPALALRLLRP